MKTKKEKLLVVDDIQINRMILKEIFIDQYDVIEASNGLEALALLQLFGEEIIIVLLDIVMPLMDGLKVLQRMNDSGIIKKIPVILITGEDDDEKALRSYDLGVSDLMYKPFNSEIVQRRVQNIIDLYSYKKYLEQKYQEQKIEIEKQTERIKNTNMFMIDALSTTVEFRNLESGEHVKRIREFTKLLLENWKDVKLSADEIDSITSASSLHDIGKIAIPDSVLCKPGRLTKEEFDIMKTHTVRGCEILETLDRFQDRDYYKYCYDICRYHHERWDGRGYPDGLTGDQIPVWAQATSVADVYDALTSKRVYKASFTHEDAVKMILNGECGIFNPSLLECFDKIQDKFLALTQKKNSNASKESK